MYSNFSRCSEKLSEIKPVDFFLAKKLVEEISDVELSKSDSSLLFHIIMALSHALGDGHSCLSLDGIAEKVLWKSEIGDAENKDGFYFPNFSTLHDLLSKLPIEHSSKLPVVFELDRLYLRRYWTFEVEVAVKLNVFMENKFSIDTKNAKTIISALFNQKSFEEIDNQRVAVANSLDKQLSIIAGGPGTGKTTTVTKLLLALQMINNSSLRIAMAAPTGKAAQRLTESINKTKSKVISECELPVNLLEAIPEESSTLHRLLGPIKNSHNFKFNETNLLEIDILLIDEISMVDLPLMARILRALPDHARLILLGDADQLPSVAAGSILADIAPRDRLGYKSENASYLNDLTGYELEVNPDGIDHLSLLTYSHRFSGSGGIGKLADAVINGHEQVAWELLFSGEKELNLTTDEKLIDWITPLVERYIVPLFKSNDIDEAFTHLNNFRFLCATRKGDHGVKAVNETIEEILRKKGLVSFGSNLYHGKPIMVSANDYGLGLFNGDIGIVWKNNQGKLLANFPTGKDEDDNNTYRTLSPARLPQVETVFAMTIHKTQGSEFENIGMILPEQDSPILSRELIYTGITRSKEHIDMLSSEALFKKATSRRIQRYSALQERLFN